MGPCAQVMPELLITADGGPEDVVRDAVAIEKVDRRALLDDSNMGNKRQPLLVDGDALRRGGEGFAGNGFNVNHRLAIDSGNLAVNGSGKGRGGKRGHDSDASESDLFHVFSWFKKVKICVGASVDELQPDDHGVGSEGPFDHFAGSRVIDDLAGA